VNEDDRELTTLSLTHLFGLGHLHVYAALGATLYIENGLRDVPRLLDLVESEHITSFPGTPAGFKIMIELFPEMLRSRAQHLRYIVINTAPMPVALTESLLELLPDTRVYMYYGLTEASRSTYIAYREHRDKLATVGRASPGGEVRIGSAAHPLINEPGEILVRGPHVTSGYWAQDSTELFDDGWFRTGDLGSVDVDGFVTWRGRVREQINVNGLKLVPFEVEDVLRRDPRVAECAVVGVPDAVTGESVAAFVVPVSAAEESLELELRKLCARHLEFYKVPKRIVFVDEIPKTDSGKVRRFLLRDSVGTPA
jgi:long-chain acyl-CoA synthetase